MTAAQGFPAVHPSSGFAAEVRAGLLRQDCRTLPCRYFYDDVGSALFEAISALPEYGLSRADARVIHACAAELIRRLPPPLAVAELGSGSGVKTRRVLEELGRREPPEYYPIDVSAAALAACRRTLADVARVETLELPYLDGLREVTSPAPSRPAPAGALPGQHHRQFRPGRRRLFPGAGARRAGARRCPPAGRRPGQAGAPHDRRLRRSRRCHRRLQPQHPGPHQPRVGRRFRPAQVRPPGRLGPPPPAHRNAPARPNPPSACAFPPPAWISSCAAARPSGPSLPTSSGRTIFARWPRRAGFHCAAQWIDREWPFSENLLLPA